MYWDQIQIDAIVSRLDLLERTLSRLMNHELRIETLEFNSGMPTNPSIHEKLMDMQHRLERLESYLLNGESK